VMTNERTTPRRWHSAATSPSRGTGSSAGPEPDEDIAPCAQADTGHRELGFNRRSPTRVGRCGSRAPRRTRTPPRGRRSSSSWSRTVACRPRTRAGPKGHKGRRSTVNRGPSTGTRRSASIGPSTSRR
jgi:hypothetical protein